LAKLGMVGTSVLPGRVSEASLSSSSWIVSTVGARSLVGISGGGEGPVSDRLPSIVTSWSYVG
jgi:hypothetical protein